jgi:hypothetical protein
VGASVRSPFTTLIEIAQDAIDEKQAEIDRLNAQAWGAAVLIQAMREDAGRVTRNAMTGMDDLERDLFRAVDALWDATSGD